MELGKQGENTGRNYGEVNTVYSNKTFEIDVVTEDGDSGGPYFKKEGDKAYIAAVHNYETWDGDSGGTSMEKVEEWAGVTV